jgi:D-glycero-D-manno-heptose 1,7-bisphosphate phosphatase
MAPLATDRGRRRVAVFLDRDGVINRRIEGGYVRDWSEFELVPGVVDALVALTEAGATLFVVTNQRGIARGMVDPADLADIHTRLTATLADAGVALGGIYVCPHDVGQCDCRKPDVGLFRQAQDDNPWIGFASSHMVGDSLSDAEAGARLDMQLWLVGGDSDQVRTDATEGGFVIEGVAPSLSDLVRDGSLVAALTGT